MAVLISTTVWAPPSMGLKALQGGYVSEGQRLRDVLRDQIEVFARQVESGEGVGPDERALLQALLSRGKDKFVHFVVNAVYPTSEEDCFFSFESSSLQCEPCGRCYLSFQVKGGYTPLPGCALLKEQGAAAHDSSSCWSVSSAAAEDVAAWVGLSNSTADQASQNAAHRAAVRKHGSLGYRIQRAIKIFVRQEQLIAPTNSSCRFSVTTAQCQPASECSFQPSRRDWTPSQTCRLIPPAPPAPTPPPATP
eukprot:CAMPEP_0180269958 /NCGR_PEP_ID=MMETSP0988-20121125/2929_1 /TAXON_ID=697907 /ORGANISM="non described non described, Strain CCMP2293" /LENGTH=249 /DNA_ID=CAMNT_0022240877 /DNA_START=84 /DNA_END=830 /DNA_ORIENTATION=-